ncbi:hypothetical protein DL95DRAFT_392784 [Leptodontidium sp. 2 PMI_412]|nr:hypothetical protein DL95DRAFT_392784 [Leptodontidium sp. 2 PMI_412]
MAMTSAHLGTMSASLDVPPSQNTAPVLEFRCLYTADIRRKQKRWQDGRLKFHTFNKRVMVYDEKSNFVGDTHWKGGLDFEEGEELELERGGILVEVGECIGKRDQDLTELVDKRVKEREERVAAKVVNVSPSFLRVQGTPSGSAHLRPKPLNAMLTPSSHYGRAVVPNTSPFEERQATNRSENEPPAKRRKQNDTTSSKNGYAQNLMGATLSLSSSKPSSTPTIRYEPFKARPIQPTASEAIDLTMDDEEERRASDARRKIAKEQRAAIERPPPRQKRVKKFPPPKSGYASNLTGTPLMLSRSEPKPVVRTNTAKLQVQQRSFENEGSASETEDGFMEVEPPPKRVSHPATKQSVVQTSHQAIEQSSEEEEEEEDYSIDTSPPPKVATEIARKSKESPHHARDQVDPDSCTEEEDSFVDIEPPPKRLPDKATKVSKESIARNRALEQYSSIVDSSLKRSSKMPKIQEVPATRQIKAPKANQSFQSWSSSPPRLDYATPVLQRGGSFSTSAILKSSTVEPTPDRPMSALRIKSRPARKMMMLINRPTPRPSALNTSFESSMQIAQPPQKPTTASNEVMLSQATIKLNEFCEKQQAELEARLNRIGSKPHLGDMSSSNPDSGIDHQTMDLLLTRKAKPVQKQAEMVRPAVSKPSLVDTRKSPNKPVGVPSGTKPTASYEQCAVKNQGSSQTKDDTASPRAAPVRKQQVLPNPGPSKPAPPMSRIQDSRMDRQTSAVASHVAEEVSSASNQVDESASTAPETSETPLRDRIEETDTTNNEPTTNLQIPKTERLPATDIHKPPLEPGTTDKMASFKEPFDDELKSTDPEVLRESNSRDVVIDRQFPATVHESPKGNVSPSNGESEKCPAGQAREQSPVSPAPRSSHVEVLEHIGGPIQSSTARFRAMINPSSNARKLPPRTASPPIESTNSHPLNPSTGEPATNEAVVKAVPKSVVVAEEALNERPEPCSGPGFSSAAKSAALSTPDLAGDSSRIGPPRARLANPATRGKSLQTLAASTVDTMNPLFNPMPPPAPRISIRAERNLVRDESDVDRASERLREAPPDGPWSREAFDLFGLHGPPRVDTGRSGIPAT